MSLPMSLIQNVLFHKLLLSSSILKSFDFESIIDTNWKLISVHLSHLSTEYFHYDFGRSQSQILKINLETPSTTRLSVEVDIASSLLIRLIN